MKNFRALGAPPPDSRASGGWGLCPQTPSLRGVWSPLLFIVYINWIDQCSKVDECATIRYCKISRMLFADDLVLLSYTESGLQRTLHSFAVACNTYGMQISTAKTEVLHLSRNPDQCVLQVNGATLNQLEKFKYLEVAFTSDRRKTKNWILE